MLKSGSHVSDLIFSPGRAPQIEVSGELVELKFKGLEMLTAEDTKLIAYDLIGKNDHPIRKLEQDGSADLSYGLPGVARFRVNVFRQRGTYAIVMRVIPMDIPGFEKLNLPPVLQAHIAYGFYPAGHMIYLNTKALASLHDDLELWYARMLQR